MPSCIWLSHYCTSSHLVWTFQTPEECPCLMSLSVPGHQWRWYSLFFLYVEHNMAVQSPHCPSPRSWPILGPIMSAINSEGLFPISVTSILPGPQRRRFCENYIYLYEPDHASTSLRVQFPAWVYTHSSPAMVLCPQDSSFGPISTWRSLDFTLYFQQRLVSFNINLIHKQLSSYKVFYRLLLMSFS